MNDVNIQAMDEHSLQPIKRSFLGQYIYPLLIIGLGILTYLNSFEGAIVFDDHLYINDNLQSLWAATFNGSNLARPLIGLTLGLNYAISGFHVWSYHLLNM